MRLTEDMRLSVGELAAASGLTVRTLHHWEAVGLLVASERTGAGHRRYGVADIERLYRVLALRELGLPLADIAALLDSQDADARSVVRRHLERVEAEIERQTHLRRRLRRLMAALERDDGPPGEELIDTIEVMTMHERHYSPEQLAYLSARADELGPEGMERVQREWAELLDEVRREMEAGTDPAHPRAQELGARWAALLEQFTGGDPGIGEALVRMYKEEGVEAASQGAVDPEVMAYAARIQAAGARG
jgi:MerR family transcriptional regulator, thiopeptide resistance regulator